MAHNTNFTETDATILLGIIGVVVIGFGLYGSILDVFHGHWAWFIIDLLTSGGVAVIRGVGYAFGWIAY